jgi:hypothetical protein
MDLKNLVNQKKSDLLITQLKNDNKLFFKKCDDSGNTILLYCVCNKQEQMTELLLTYIMNNIKCSIIRDKILNQINNKGESLLYLAVKNNNLELSKILYLCGVSDKHITKKREMIKVKNDCLMSNNRYENNNKQFYMNDKNNQFNMNDKNNQFNMNDKNNQFNMNDKNNQFNMNDKNNQFNMNDNNQFNMLNSLKIQTTPFLQLLKDKQYNENNRYNENNKYDGSDENNTEHFLNVILNGCKDLKLKNGNENYTPEILFFGGENEYENENENENENEIIGGKKRIKSLNNKTVKKASRSKFKKQSSELHDKTFNEIMKLGYSIDDSKLIKAGLYSMVKEKYPDLNNYTRAEKMLEMVNKDIIEKINLSKLKKLIEKNKKDKDDKKEKNNKDDKDNKKEKKEKKEKK